MNIQESSEINLAERSHDSKTYSTLHGILTIVLLGALIYISIIVLFDIPKSIDEFKKELIEFKKEFNSLKSVVDKFDISEKTGYKSENLEGLIDSSQIKSLSWDKIIDHARIKTSNVFKTMSSSGIMDLGINDKMVSGITYSIEVSGYSYCRDSINYIQSVSFNFEMGVNGRVLGGGMSSNFAAKSGFYASGFNLQKLFYKKFNLINMTVYFYNCSSLDIYASAIITEMFNNEI